MYLLGDEKIIIIIYNFCIALFSGVHKLTALCNILPSATRWQKKKKKKSPAENLSRKDEQITIYHNYKLHCPPRQFVHHFTSSIHPQAVVYVFTASILLICPTTQPSAAASSSGKMYPPHLFPRSICRSLKT